jgi:NADH-quinone oxidoreductase subunit B
VARWSGNNGRRKTYALGGARSGVEGGFKPGQDDPFYSGLSDQLADKGYFGAHQTT